MEEATPKKQTPPQLRVRSAIDTDAPFIFNSWLKNYRRTKFAENIQSEVYFAAHHQLIEGLLKTCKTIVVTSSEDPTQIYGYGVAEEVDGVFVCHFIYVKETYRRLGIGSLIIKELGHPDLSKPFMYTHKTTRAFILETSVSMIYHPYLAFHGYVDASKKAKNEPK